jgi:hypothetical protein
MKLYFLSTNIPRMHMYLTVTLGSLKSVGRSFVSGSVHKIQLLFLSIMETTTVRI